MADIKPIYSTPPEANALPTPFQEHSYSPDQFGAGVGDELRHLSKEYEKAQHDANVSAGIGAIGQGKQVLNDLILDPEKGYASLKGSDALAQREKVLKAFDDGLTKIGASLTNDDQRRMWMAHEVTIREQGYTHVLSHESMQIEQLAQAKFQGAVDQTTRAMQAPGVLAKPTSLDQQLSDLQNIAHGEALRRFGGNPPPEAVASIVGKTMQKGALDAMNGALATENPAIVTSTFQRVGQYLGEHEHTYGNFVRGVAQKAQISAQSSLVIAAGLQQVAMPDGTIVPRVDGVKTAAALLALPPDTALLPEIQKTADQREKVIGDLWSKSVAQVYERVHSAGQDPSTGAFDMQSRKIAPQDKAWLNQFAPTELDKLRALDARAQRAASGEDRITSGEYRSLVSADLHDPARWAEIYGKMTPGQFLSFVTDDKQFPGGMLPRDRIAVQKEFQSLQQGANKLEEPVGKTVKEHIASVFPDDSYARGEFERQFFTKIQDKANAFIASEKAAGRKVDTKAVGEFVDQQLADVPGTGWLGFGQKRRIELDPGSALQPPPVNAATPAAAPRPRRTVNGVTKEWNGREWVIQ